MLSLHRRIRTLRARRGLTGLELARRVGVSPSYVSLIEHGEKVPSEDVAVRIAQALDDREDLYRVWSAMARMDERTRRALLSLSHTDPDVAPYLELDSVERDPRTTVPPPHLAHAEEAPPLVRLFRKEALERALPVPLLVSGEIASTDRPSDAEIRAALAIDGALVGRGTADGLVALQVDEANGARVQSWLRPDDVAILDCRIRTIDPSRIHLVRLPDRPPAFSRLSLADGERTLWLLPDPGDGSPPERIDLADRIAATDMIVGAVVLTIRKW